MDGLDWPAQSLDLNPTEHQNSFGEVEQRLHIRPFLIQSESDLTDVLL